MTHSETLRPTLLEGRAWLLSLVFVVGNLALPQLCHLAPQGGLRWLPIYFFTLIAAFRYGRAVGLVTALASPLLNAWLFHMPPAEALPVILLKSTLLALAASYFSARRGLALPLALVLTVATYQLLGGCAEMLLTRSLTAPLHDLTTGLPGLLLQVFGGWASIYFLETRRKG